MKVKMLMFILSKLIIFTCLGQNQTSHKLPPMKMLPKNGDTAEIYELPYEANFKVYNRLGELIDSNYGQFIDYTDFEDGVYFIKFNDKTITFEKVSNPFKTYSDTGYLPYLIGFTLFVLVILFWFFKYRIGPVKNEQVQLHEEIKKLKEQSIHQETRLTAFSEKIELDKNRIEKIIEGNLNPTDWKIIETLVNQPSISNKELSNQVLLSVEGTRSSLKKMYKLFEIPSSRNMRLALVLKLVKVSNQRD